MATEPAWVYTIHVQYTNTNRITDSTCSKIFTTFFRGNQQWTKQQNKTYTPLEYITKKLILLLDSVFLQCSYFLLIRCRTLAQKSWEQYRYFFHKDDFYRLPFDPCQMEWSELRDELPRKVIVGGGGDGGTNKCGFDTPFARDQTPPPHRGEIDDCPCRRSPQKMWPSTFLTPKGAKRGYSIWLPIHQEQRPLPTSHARLRWVKCVIS